nr:MAG TPA: hypothetical protein [Caudoviricetes sp.]
MRCHTLYIDAASEQVKGVNRKHRQFYYNPLYISLICMECDNLGLCRAAFLFNSSNCHTPDERVKFISSIK